MVKQKEPEWQRIREIKDRIDLWFPLILLGEKQLVTGSFGVGDDLAGDIELIKKCLNYRLAGLRRYLRK